jgi:hypothetical protein
MHPSQQAPNQWLISYIEQYKDKKSRYEIDRYLIEAGYNGSEIETGWQYVQNSKVSFEIENIAEISDANKALPAVLGCIMGSISLPISLFGLYLANESYYDDNGELVSEAQIHPDGNWFALLCILVSLLAIFGSWLVMKYPRWGGLLQLFTAFAYVLLFAVFSAHYFLASIFVVTFTIAGSLGVRSDITLPVAARKFLPVIFGGLAIVIVVLLCLAMAGLRVI